MDIARLPEQIHIIGAPGSGKTTLARKLHSQLNLPCYHLDYIAFEGGIGRKTSIEARNESLRTIVAQPRWISEGSFIWWTKPLLDAAALIIWLDLPVRISALRITKRYLQLSWARANPHPSPLTLIHLMSRVVDRQIRRTPRVPKSLDDDTSATRVAEAKILSHYPTKLIHCKTTSDVARICALVERRVSLAG